MKLKLCALLSVVLGLLGSELHAGNLKVDLAPAAAVSAGAQWRVDGGSWRNSGSTATGLTNGTHTVSYKAVTGWLTPANASATISGSATTSLTGTYVSPAALKITLTPATGTWRIDGGAWQASGATVTGLTPGTHSVDYQALSGYNVPAPENVTLTAGQTTTLTRAYIQQSALKITLTPTTGKWRIDSGTWQSSGATVSGLNPGAHTVDYQAVSGYNAPAAESVTLVSGQTTTLSRAYVQQSALKITLTPTTGKWRIDGGTWQSSGATVSGLTPGAHSVDYQPLSGYNVPATESVTLISGQTTTLTRAYVQLAQLTVNLNPSSGQWRIDGGAWRTSGTTATGLTPGAHNLEFASVSGFSSPPAENVTLTAAQSLTLTRNYTALAKLSVTLAPTTGQWRIDGGAWRTSGTLVSDLGPGSHIVDYLGLSGYSAPASETVSLVSGQTTALTRAYIPLASLSVTLNPAFGQWRVDGGAWQASTAIVANLAPGNHTVDFAALPGYMALSPETISLSAGQAGTLQLSYTPLVPLTINLDPAAGQWRANAGPWQASGATLTLPPTEYTIEYSALTDYDAPPTETISLASGQAVTASRVYTTQKPSLRVNLTTPINGLGQGQWRIDGGAWRSSGVTLYDLTAGNHTLDYIDLGGPFLPLASETISLALRENAVLNRAYALKPLASLTVTLDPSAAQWRVDGGAWQSSGATVGGLQYDTPLAIDYAPAAGYTAPSGESVTLASGQSLAINRSYAPFPKLSVVLNPAAAQWRVDGGAWQASGASLTLAPGTHSLEYGPQTSWIAPATESVTLTSGQVLALNRDYTPVGLLAVNLTPASAQWRLDGGAWTASGNPILNISLGTHTIEYSPLAGYIAPPSESVVIVGGINPTLTRSYTPLATFGVTLNPASAQWRIDGGAWNASGAFFTNLSLGTHTIDYSTVAGYITPPSESVVLVSGTNAPLTRSYTQFATFGVTLTPSTAQWRMVGAPGTTTWFASGASFTQITPGTYTIEFSDVQGYITPAPEVVTLVSGSNPPLSRTYAPLASFSVTLTPSTAQWRMVGAPGTTAWFASGTSFTQIALGTYTIEFSDVPGYITPASEQVTLVSGPNPPLTRTYVAQPTQFTVSLTPTSGQWRVDGGTWQSSGDTVNGLTSGTSHTVEFLDLAGYLTPSAQTITLAAAEHREIAVSYTQLAALSVSLNPASATWRVDGGNWISSGDSVPNLSLGAHTVDYGPVDGFITPPTESVNLVGGPNAFSRDYVPVPSAFNILKNFENAGASPAMFFGQDGLIYGAMGSGGNRGAGYLFKMNPDGSALQVLHNFPSETGDGLAPNALFEGSDGMLYGTTNNGGTGTNNGVLFRVNKDGTGYARLRSFATLSEGSTPTTLMEGSNGVLYGSTILGGASGKGVIFRSNKDGSGFAIVRSLSSSDGTNIRGLIEGPGGLLFGVAAGGGTSGIGTLFRVGLDGSSFNVLKNFAGTTDGSTPRGGLLLGSDGLLYGTTSRGGAASNNGLVFRIGTDGSGYQVLHQFLGQTTDGFVPQLSLTEGADGVLYGSTLGGGAGSRGTLFRLGKDGNGYSVIIHFTGGLNDGGLPNHKVLVASNGTLYGSNGSGGGGTAGLIFKVNPDGSNFAAVKQLGAIDGFFPSAALTVGSSGTIYGSAYSGGANNAGTVFKMSSNGTGFTVLHHFVPATDGGLPLGRVIEGSDGRLYGTTSDISSSVTVLFRMNADGTNYAILHSFGALGDGDGPQGIIESSDGFLYGTTSGGGAASLGTIFRINKDGTSYSILRSFAGGTADGQYPYASVIEGNDGRLYGTTDAGGSGGFGTVYVLNRNGTGYSVLRHFAGGAGDGATPYSGLFQGSDGLLYGTTTAGGAGGVGTVFKLKTDGTGYGVIKHFLGGTADGANPYYAGVIERNNLLYGVAAGGGTFNAGVIYSLQKDGSGYQVEVNLGAGSSDSAFPAAGLALSADGVLYGTSAYGGTGSTVFAFRPH